MKQKNSITSVQSSFSSKPNQSYAPFGSVSPRSKKKKKGQKLSEVGPGAYDISLPIIKPIIQTIKKKNNNIIVKLAHLGTSSFLGQRDRFQDQFQGLNAESEKLGPGKYSPERSFDFLENKSKEKTHERPHRKQAGIQLAKFIKNRQRKAATFSQVKKISIQDYVQMPDLNESRKQDQEDQVKKKLNKIKGTAWSMMKQQRLKDVKNPYKNIGPGQYYVDDFGKQHYVNKLRSVSQQYPTSSFRSQSVRSFFDCIRFETNQQKKALLREASGFKSDSLGPGAYQVNAQKNLQNKFQFFGSTVERS